MLFVALSICATVIVLNVHFRALAMRPMSKQVQRLFLNYLPNKLGMRRPVLSNCHANHRFGQSFTEPCFKNGFKASQTHLAEKSNEFVDKSENVLKCNLDEIFQNVWANVCRHPCLVQTFANVEFLASHTWHTWEKHQINEDWAFVALVLDRFFMWIFLIAVLLGTLVIGIFAFIIK